MTQGKTATLIGWAKTQSDTRHTASAVYSVTVTQESALNIARCLEEDPARAIEAFDLDIQTSNNAKPASGHGITINYSSGKRRSVPRHLSGAWFLQKKPVWPKEQK